MNMNARRRLMWLIGGRAAVVTLLLGSAILTQIRGPAAPAIEDPFFFLIAITYALTVLYVVLIRQAEQHRWLVDVQLACDAILVSALVHMTNGVSSYFTSLYALPIIAASTIQSQRSGLMVGVLSSLLYAGIVGLQYLGAPVSPALTGTDLLPQPRIALFILGLNVFGFMAVAVLSGYLAQRLRDTGQALEHASNQLADLRAFSEHVISSLASGLATTDIDGRILSFNKAAETIIGVTQAQALQRSAAEVLQLPSEFNELFGAREGRPRLPRVEYVFTCGDGRDIEIGISTAMLKTPRAEVGFVFTFLDVTDARKQERQARVQQRLAAVGEMAAGIAHEIRNPLASMSGSLQILRQELPLSEEQSQLMDIVLRESDRLNETIRSFLAYARPQRSAFTRFDVRQVLTDTATLLQNSPELIETHEIRSDVPSEPVWCLADSAQIRQIVWNLATNGLRSMADGGTLTLTASIREADAENPEKVVIAISDEGIGIAPEDLEGIFQPFHGGFARGTGLGLSIVHRIVSDYGGELLVKSQKGQGTTVTVLLPAVEQPAAAAASPATSRA
jgi:two-component system sensor histidine kinase PilS (NtrC family)